MQSEDEGDEICPVCDGDCTCRTNNSAQNIASITPILRKTPTPHPPPPMIQSLKIKFTVPPGILGSLQAKRVSQTRTSKRTTSAVGNAGDTDVDSLTPPPLKRRSRRPKSLAQPLSSSTGKPKPAGRTTARDGLTGSIDAHDSDASGPFPTFVSTFSTAAENDEESSDSSIGSRDSVEAEEENFIVAEESVAQKRARVMRELMGSENDGSGRRWDRRDRRVQPRKKRFEKSVEAAADVDTDSDDEDDEEEDEDAANGDDDAEPDDNSPADLDMVFAALSPSDDDTFDADVFFASLSDSTRGSSMDGDSDRASSDESDSDRADLTKRAAEVLDTPLVVKKGWDGQLVFATELKAGQGMLDIDFELSAAAHKRKKRVKTESASGSAMDYSTDSDSVVDHIDMELLESDAGETTDDEPPEVLGTPRGIAPIVFPNTPSASTPFFESIMAAPAHPRLCDDHAELSSLPPSSPVEPTAVLVRSRSLPANSSIASSPGPHFSPGSRKPTMGEFVPVGLGERRRLIINDAKKDIPSPFAKRLRRMLEARKRRPRSGSDPSPNTAKRHRDSSASGSTRSSFVYAPSEVPSSPELPPVDPLHIFDVLDPSLLDVEDSAMEDMEASQLTASDDNTGQHLRNLSRWDRIPMGAFRHLRYGGHSSLEDVNFDLNGGGLLSIPRQIDGYSYDSPIRASPPRRPYAQTGSEIDFADGSRKKRKKGRKSPSPKAGMTYVISPLLFPVGDHPANNNSLVFSSHQQWSSVPQRGSAKSHKTKRKEKKAAKGPIPRSLTAGNSRGPNPFFNSLAAVPTLHL